MSKRTGKIAAFFAGFAAFFMMGCSSGGGSSISPLVFMNNNKTSNTGITKLEPGTFYEETVSDPAYAAASTILNEIDPNNQKYILFSYIQGKSDYSDRTAYLWVVNGSACTTAMTTKTVNGVTLGYLVFIDENGNAAAGVPADVKTTLTAGGSIKAIVKNTGSTWSWQTNDCDLIAASGDKHFLITSGSESKSENKTYTVATSVRSMITNAKADSKNTILVTINKLYGLDTSAGNSGFALKEGSNTLTISDSINADTNDKSLNATKNIKLTVQEDLEVGKTYTLSNPKFGPDAGVTVDTSKLVKDSPAYDGNDLGLTLNGSSATFKTWAPVASSVELLLYTTMDNTGSFNSTDVTAKQIGKTTDTELEGTVAKTVTMTKGSNGVWAATEADVSSYKYYKFKINNGGTTYYVSDIWGKACSPDAIASEIVDINTDTNAISGLSRSYGSKANYYTPFSGSYENAVIYEMHVTDWSYAAGLTNSEVGKYTTIKNSTEVINHIKDLGVTHVQILPVFEFAETDKNTNYNWGYNPYHYNVPEGRYATADYTDGTTPVNELRALIEKFHSEGIAVIMDVVYNHTSGTGIGSLYDSTVPGYFYRKDASGAYSNGSGCGNEIDAEAAMVKKYIIESLKHWMLDYHVNGFRFDLMGVLSKETMADIYAALYDIDPKVMVYGEPWTGGTSMVTNSANQAVSTTTGVGVGAFDDDFRDAIKGAEFGGFRRGQVQNASRDADIIKGLLGKVGNNKRNETGKLGLALHYVECHDNYTLFDKLILSTDSTVEGEGNWKSKFNPALTAVNADAALLTKIQNEDTLAAAYIFLSQGTPFINGGQEFLRSKKGDENSYKSFMSINGIKLSRKTEYESVYNIYKALIALRKANSTAFGANTSATATTVSTGVTKYITGDFLVYFNASDAAVTVDSSTYTKEIALTTGAVVENSISTSSLPAKSFVIFKK